MAQASDVFHPGTPGAESSDSAPRLSRTASALKACDWDVDRALGVLRLLASRNISAEVSRALSESYCVEVLQHVRGDLALAERLLEVHQRFGTTPLAVCAEALRRGDSHASAACSLLEDFRGRVRGLVVKAWRSQDDAVREEGAAEQVAYFALEVAEWNPSVAFMTAESFALALLQVRREWNALESRARTRATAHVQYGDGTTEAELAEALTTLDSLDALRSRPVSSISETLRALQDTAMEPMTTARQLWQIGTGIAVHAGPLEKPEKPPVPPKPPAPPTAASAKVQPDRCKGKTKGQAKPSAKSRKNPREDCSLM